MRGVFKVAAIAFAIMILAGLLVTAVGRWRETANRTRCQYHLGRVGLHALWNYTDPHGALPAEPAERARLSHLPETANPDPSRLFPGGTVAHSTLPPEKRLSWCAVLTPYLQSSELIEHIDLAHGWEYEPNRAAATTLVAQLICPSQFRKHDPTMPAPTHFIGMAGYGVNAPLLKQTDRHAGMFRYDDPTRVGMLARGLSYTVSFLETNQRIGPWIAGGASTVRGYDPQVPLLGTGAQFGGIHPHGGNVAFADGSVRFQAANMSRSIFALQVTLAEFSAP